MKKIKATIAAILAVCAMLNLTGCSEKREPNSDGTSGNVTSQKESGASSDETNTSSSSPETSSSSSNSSETSSSSSSSSETSSSSSSVPDKKEPENNKGSNNTSNGNTLNSIRLFDAITADKDNAMFSPLSLDMALGLVEMGAKGNTKSAIDTYLQTQNYADYAQSYLKFASEELSKKEVNRGEWERYPRSVVEIANSVWTDDAMPLKDEYKRNTGSKYDAEIQNVDFGNSEETANKINKWANKKTHEMIPNLLEPDALAPDTAAVLINTVYFESPWEWVEWRVDENNKESFTLSDGTVKEMPLMYSYGDSYFENDSAEAFSRNYVNGTKFIGILPKKKSGDFTLEELDIPSLLKSENSSGYEVSAVMPRLKFDSKFDLKDPLCAAGLEVMFDPGSADFSGMSDVPLFITDAIQMTSLELDEKGTKAAAATMVIAAGGGADPKPIKTVRLDRPFAFLIYDSAHEQILFMGKVTEP